MEHISATQFLEEVRKAEKKFYVLDVRTETEYKRAKLADIASDNVPLDEVPDVMDTIIGHCGEMRTYILCKAGKRAEFAGQDLEDAGVKDVVVIEGGTMALETLETAFKPNLFSIERQYYVLMAVAILLGTAVNMLWFLPVLAAASLIFRAVTEECGVAEALKIMPWNDYLRKSIKQEIAQSVSAYQNKKAVA